MALITCPECTREMSDTAPACPHCGYRRTATTIEETGKRWKGLPLGGALAAVLGFTLLLIGPSELSSSPLLQTAMLLLCIGGILVYSYARLQAWWHHG